MLAIAPSSIIARLSPFALLAAGREVRGAGEHRRILGIEVDDHELVVDVACRRRR